MSDYVLLQVRRHAGAPYERVVNFAARLRICMLMSIRVIDRSHHDVEREFGYSRSMKRWIAACLILVGFQNLATFDASALSTTQDVPHTCTLHDEIASSQDDGGAPAQHTHSCSEQDVCGHRCHFGHCAFVTSTNGVFVNLLSQALSPFYDGLHASSFRATFFRPPIV
jgi:hypothetical protein